ncbi:MAG: hypothetical protein WA021_05770 [Minisyncoccia bacterium]
MSEPVIIGREKILFRDAHYDLERYFRLERRWVQIAGVQMMHIVRNGGDSIFPVISTQGGIVLVEKFLPSQGEYMWGLPTMRVSQTSSPVAVAYQEMPRLIGYTATAGDYELIATLSHEDATGTGNVVYVKHARRIEKPVEARRPEDMIRNIKVVPRHTAVREVRIASHVAAIAMTLDISSGDKFDRP